MEDSTIKTVGVVAGVIGTIAVFGVWLFTRTTTPTIAVSDTINQNPPTRVEQQTQWNPANPNVFNYNRPGVVICPQNPIHTHPINPNPVFAYNKPRYVQEVPVQAPMSTPLTYAKPVEVAQPSQYPTYNPGYAWGNYAYINAIASTPLQQPSTYQFTYNRPVQNYVTNDGYAWSSNYGGTMYQPPMYSPPPTTYPSWQAPPVQTMNLQPPMNQSQNATRKFEFISPAQKEAQKAADEAAYYAKFGDGSVRTMDNGVQTAFKIPAYYNDDGTWRG